MLSGAPCPPVTSHVVSINLLDCLAMAGQDWSRLGMADISWNLSCCVPAGQHRSRRAATDRSFPISGTRDTLRFGSSHTAGEWVDVQADVAHGRPMSGMFVITCEMAALLSSPSRSSSS
jgi:hypothetical protein